MTHAAHVDDFVPCGHCGSCLACDPHTHTNPPANVSAEASDLSAELERLRDLIWTGIRLFCGNCDQDECRTCFESGLGPLHKEFRRIDAAREAGKK